MKYFILFITLSFSILTFSQKKIKPELLGQLILNAQQLDKKIDGDFLSQKYIFKEILGHRRERKLAQLFLFPDSVGLRTNEPWTISLYSFDNNFYSVQMIIPITDITKTLSIIGKDRNSNFTGEKEGYMKNYDGLYYWDTKFLSITFSKSTNEFRKAKDDFSKLIDKSNLQLAKAFHKSGKLTTNKSKHDATLWFNESLFRNTKIQEAFFGYSSTRDFQRFLNAINYKHEYIDFSMNLDFKQDKVNYELTYTPSKEFVKKNKDKLNLKSQNNLSEYLDPNAIANSSYFMDLDKMLPLLERSLLGEREFRKFKSISRIFLSNKYYKDVLDGNVALSYLRDTTKEESYIAAAAVMGRIGSEDGEEEEKTEEVQEVQEVRTYTTRVPLILGAIGITNSPKVDSMMNYFIQSNIIQKHSNHYRLTQDTSILFRRTKNAFIVSNDSAAIFQTFKPRDIKSNLMAHSSIENIVNKEIKRTTRERTLREYAVYNSYFKDIQYNGFLFKKKKIHHTITLPLKKSTHNSATTLLQFLSDFLEAQHR